MKRMLRCAAFFLILFVILQVLGVPFIAKNNTIADGMERKKANALGVLAEPEGTLDVLFIGDSVMTCGVIPLVLWDEFGISSYNCSMDGTRLYHQIPILEQVLEKHKPKYVVMDAHIFFWEYMKAEHFGCWVMNQMPLLEYHNNWKNFSAEDLLCKPNWNSPSDTKGYYAYNTQEQAGDPPAERPLEECEAYYPQLENAVLGVQIREICEKNGVELLLIKTPQLRYWYNERRKAMNEIAAEYGFAYTDFSAPGMTDIDWSTDTSDGGDHLNYQGGVKFTRILGEFLKEKGGFSDKRALPEYAQWNELADHYEQKYGHIS